MVLSCVSAVPCHDPLLARKLAPAPDQRDTPEPGEVVLMDAIEALQRTLRGEFEDGALQLALLFAAQQQLF